MENKNPEQKKEYIQPLTSIYEEKGSVVVKLEMPGVEKDKTNIRVDSDQLIITGSPQRAESKGTYILRERPEADFRKIFTLEETVDREKIVSVMEKGILTLILNLKESVKPKKIQIRTR